MHLQRLLEDPWVDEHTACVALLQLMGSEVPDDVVLTRHDVLTSLAVDRTNPASIAYSLSAARENARRAREIVSTELWECLNATQLRLPDRVPMGKTHDYFAWVRERAALAVGIVESSASRDEAWLFFTLGRSLEQADMTARLVATRSLSGSNGPSWTTILRSCGGYESYLRTYRGVPSAQNAAEYLLLDRLFPRSIVFSISRAEQCLRALEPRSDRVGVSERAQRLLGRIRSQLEYRPIREILNDLPMQMDVIQKATTTASQAIADRYFPTHTAQSWSGEAS